MVSGQSHLGGQTTITIRLTKVEVEMLKEFQGKGMRYKKALEGKVESDLSSDCKRS